MLKQIAIRLVVAGVCLFAGSATTWAAVITFDEFPADNHSGAMPALRYAALGVTFVATDEGATWGGLSAGDPGNWGLEGTNGPIFSGFNGGTYALTMLFNTDVTNVSFDASRSAGSQPGDTLTVEAWLNGAVVGNITGFFGDINVWTGFEFSGPLDELRLVGAGAGFHPFGIDNIRWDAAAVPEPATLFLFGAAMCGVGVRRLRRR